MKSTNFETRRTAAPPLAARPIPYYLGHLLIYLGLLLLALAGLWLGGKIIVLATAARTANEHARRVETQLAGGVSDPAALAEDARQTAAALQTLHAEFAPFAPLVPALENLPGAGQNPAVLPELLSAAADVSRAGQLLLDAALPANPDAAPGWAAAVERLAGQRAELGELARRLETHQSVLAPINAATLWPQLAEPLTQLRQILPVAISGVKLAQASPAIFGFDGPQTYLLLTQNADELRPGGGYINAAGHITVSRGQITEFVMQDSYGVDRLSDDTPFPPPPLFHYMGAEYWVLRDTSWSPDFPTAAQTALELYRQGQDIRADGVIALDQHALPLLLAALGPLDVDGERVTGGNVLELMRRHWSPQTGRPMDSDWWAQRKSFMLALAQTARAKIETDPQSINLPALAAAAQQALAQKHLLLYLPPAGDALAKLRADGALAAEPGDFLMITDANVGFNKASARVERQLTARIQLDDDGTARTQARITYRHTAPPRTAPCDITVRYDPLYAQNTERCYWNYVTLIVPESARLQRGPHTVVEGQFLLLGKATDGSIDHTALPAGKIGWSQLTLLPPGQTLALNFDYTQTAAAVQSSDGVWAYRLVLQKQPGTLTTPAQIRIVLPDRARLVSAQPSPVEQTGTLLTFGTDWATDESIYLRYRLE